MASNGVALADLRLFINNFRGGKVLQKTPLQTCEGNGNKKTGTGTSKSNPSTAPTRMGSRGPSLVSRRWVRRVCFARLSRFLLVFDRPAASSNPTEATPHLPSLARAWEQVAGGAVEAEKVGSTKPAVRTPVKTIGCRLKRPRRFLVALVF